MFCGCSEECLKIIMKNKNKVSLYKSPINSYIYKNTQPTKQPIYIKSYNITKEEVHSKELVHTKEVVDTKELADTREEVDTKELIDTREEVDTKELVADSKEDIPKSWYNITSFSKYFN